MHITVESVFYSRGQFGFGKGLNPETGEPVYFAGDWRPMRDLGRLLEHNSDLECEIEDWQIISFEQYMAEQAQDLTDVGPYVDVTFDKIRACGSKHYRIVAYGGYNANGLVGREDNGILVLCEEDLSVVADEIGLDAAYGTPAAEKRRVRLAERLFSMHDDEFAALINRHPRKRPDQDIVLAHPARRQTHLPSTRRDMQLAPLKVGDMVRHREDCSPAFPGEVKAVHEGDSKPYDVYWHDEERLDEGYSRGDLIAEGDPDADQE